MNRSPQPLLRSLIRGLLASLLLLLLPQLAAEDVPPIEEQPERRLLGRSDEQSLAGKVVVIHVGQEDLINKQAFRFWKRTLERADQDGARAIVLELDTPGGLAFDTGPAGSLLDGLAPITGKTHTVELAFGGLGVNEHHGTPRNPWDAEHARVPGGSSAGAGVSLWEGSALVALGTDTAGSVRIPASMTGTVGLKTTPGRWPTAGIVPLSPTLDTAGLLARTAADAAWAFAALDPGSPDPRALVEPLDLRLVAVEEGHAGAGRHGRRHGARSGRGEEQGEREGERSGADERHCDLRGKRMAMTETLGCWGRRRGDATPGGEREARRTAPGRVDTSPGVGDHLRRPPPARARRASRPPSVRSLR